MTSILTLALLPLAAHAGNPHDETTAELEAIESRLSDMETQLDSLEADLDTHATKTTESLAAIESLLDTLSSDLETLGIDLYTHDTSLATGLSKLDTAVSSVSTDTSATAASVAAVSTELADLTTAVDTLESTTSAAVAEIDSDISVLGYVLDSTRDSVSQVYLQVDDLADTVIAEVETTRVVASETITIGGDGPDRMSVNFECDAPYTVLNAYFYSGHEGLLIENLYIEGLQLGVYIYDESPFGTDMFRIAEPQVPQTSGDAYDTIGFEMIPMDLPSSDTTASGYGEVDYDLYWVVRTTPDATCEFTTWES